MVNVVAKTPNKRKSLGGNAVSEVATSPKKPKLNGTPAKNPINKSPAKINNKTPAKTPQGPKATATPKGPKPTISPKGPKTPQVKGESPEKNNKRKRAKKNKVATNDGVKIEKSAQLNAGHTPAPKKMKKRQTGDKRSRRFDTLLELAKGGKGLELVADLTKKIAVIQSRKELTKTARRKLRILEKCKYMAEHDGAVPPQKQRTGAEGNASKKRRERRKASPETKTLRKAQQKVQDEINKGKKVKAAAGDVKKEEVNEGSSDSDYDVEDSITPTKIIKTEDEEESEVEEEEESDAVDEEDSDGEMEANPPQGKQTLTAVKLDDLKKSNIVGKGQKRYVLFVGNLPFILDKQEIIDHFAKVGNIRDVRMQFDKKTGRSRGFAYVEVENENAYQRALSMHHTSIKDRRINVLYSQGGKKKGEDNKSLIKAKNFKLHAMRKQGQLAGSVKPNQKRAGRRAKAANGS